MRNIKIKTLALALAGVGVVTLPTSPAFANPVDGKVVAGSVTIQQESATKLGITQTSNKAIVDWKSFSIGANEHTQIYQPSASAVILNRVVGEDPSKILGRLTANGQVFLVNPNGIFFGKNAQIDVASLVASTHNIRNEDFLAGKYNFNIPGKPGASVINEGTIRIADTGIAAFVAPSIANRGVIVAKLGKVMLAAANGFTLDFSGDQLLTFLVDDEVAQTAFDIEGKQLTSFIENAGRIEAQGGYVLLTAKAAENAIHGVINQSGAIEATTVGTHNGEIILNAGKGSVSVSGVLDASAPNGGDGGFIETSGGKVGVGETARITTAAPYGNTGRWLIDPTDYTIAASDGNITGAALAGYLAGNNVEIQTLTTGSGNGDIFVNDAVAWNTTNKLTLTAYRDINVNQHINAMGGGSIKLRADSTALSRGTVAFGGSGRITVNNGASVGIYYNPVSYTDTATRSDTTGNPYGSKITRNTGSTFTAYMLVNDVNQLQAMKDRPTGRYALGKNIDASATAGLNGGKGFIPVGTSTQTFSGTFFGDDHVINGLTINDPTLAMAGLFGVIGANGKVFHVGLANAIVRGQEAGILAGRSYGSVTQVYATGSITAYSAGGLIGKNWGVISQAFSSGTVTATAGGSAGGLVASHGAYATGGIISDSFTTSVVTVPFLDLGNGIFQGQIGSLAADNSGTIARTYATGQIVAQGRPSFPPPWGLIGGNSGNASSSYWDTETTGPTMNGGAGLGRTTAEMKQAATFAGWDFTNVWRINEGTSYPYLAWTASTTVEARQLLQPSGSTSFVGSSVGPTTKVVTDICSVAPVVCRPELAPVPPRVEKANSGSVSDGHANNPIALSGQVVIQQGNFILDGVSVARLPDGSKQVSLNAFNTGFSDAVMEVFDANGNRVGWQLIEGNKLQDSIVDAVTSAPKNISEQLFGEYGFFDPRNQGGGGSKKTEVKSIGVPPGGYVKISNDSDIARATNFLTAFVSIMDKVGGVEIPMKKLPHAVLTAFAKELAKSALLDKGRKLFGKSSISMGDVKDFFEMDDARKIFGIFVDKVLMDPRTWATGMDQRVLNGVGGWRGLAAKASTNKDASELSVTLMNAYGQFSEIENRPTTIVAK